MKGNMAERNRVRTQRRTALKHELDRVRQAASKNKDLRFTALWHHVYKVDRLREAYLQLKRKAAAGVDGVTWEMYGENLEGNLTDLSDRLKRGAYRAKPVRRVYIPKADGRQRPLGVTATEDKIVQRATVEVLNAIYEVDFHGFSYGFRPGRSQHNALDAVFVAMKRRKVNWVLDADIRGFFDAISHEWLVRFLEHRIGDQRVLRHIKKWLHAGVLEGDTLWMAEDGTPQGGSISPLLANIYLHYALDNWVELGRKRYACGDMIIVRYADDFIVGFEVESDATQFREQLEHRLRRFSLELHPTKTRLLRFGRFAAEDRKRLGEGKPETFDFLGFTHICGKTRRGKFVLTRKTKKKKLRAKLKEIKAELRKRLHDDPHITGKWLRSVLNGHYQYYGVPLNLQELTRFREAVGYLWRLGLRRRSQRGSLTWAEMRRRLIDRWLPRPRITHPWPDQRLRVIT